MKVVQKKAEDGKIFLEAVASEKEVNNALDSAHIAFAQSMGLSPQPGKTVAQAAEEYMGIKNLDSVVESSASEALIPLALDKKNLCPAIPPQLTAKSPFKRNCPFTFELTVTPKAQYELNSYDPVEITVAPFSFDEKIVDEQIENIAQQYTTYVTADPKPIEVGDSCLLTMESFEDGKKLKGLTSKKRTYVAGQGFMPESFDKQILGMEPGQTKTFTFEGFTSGEDEKAPIIDCTVTILELQKPSVPQIDDEWIKENMPMYKDLQDMRHALSQRYEQQALEENNNYRMQLAVTELAKRFEGSIDDEVYEAMRARLMNNIYSDLKQQGKTWEQFLEENGGEQQVSMMMMLQTREVLVQGFSLDAVYRHEHLSLTDEDLEIACRSMNPEANPKDVRKQLEESGRGFALRETAERIKANRWILDHAIVNVEE